MKQKPIYQLLSATVFLWLLVSVLACSNPEEVTPQTKASLLSRTWQVESATYAYERVTYVYYKKGSTDNDADLSAYRFTFRTDNTYTITDGTQTYSGRWELTRQDSQLDLDGQEGFAVGALTETILELSYTSDEVDDDGNVINVKTTYQLIPAA